MSNALQPYRAAGTGVSPRAARQLTRLADATDLAVAQTAAVAIIETAKLDALQQIAGRAMQSVALVSQLEQQLTQIVPLSGPRLQAIGDMHALASAEVVASAVGRLG